MSKFWGAVGVIFILAVALLLLEGFSLNGGQDRPGSSDINFRDLETECRLQPAEETSITLNDDNSLGFEGHFARDATTADLDHSYRTRNNELTLNVKSDGQKENTTFEDNCLVSVKYIASTGPLQPGVYTVKVQHDGEQVERQVIEVKRN